jgi:hypothetical protein
MSEINSENKYKKLYTIANELMLHIAIDGKVTVKINEYIAEEIMNALFEIDGGVFDNKKYGKIKPKKNHKIKPQNQTSVISVSMI